jgi:eukaryotic-like serine/threonine-protein kinase
MDDTGGAPVREGDVLAGRYRVSRVLGVGGMGIVVAAEHLELRQRVALKFLLPAAANNAMAAERFAREARVAVQIRSEHVARVLDVGRLEGGAPYMVMEYLDGQDLGDTVKARGPLPVNEATDYLLQACEAIAEAHALGIVHRDLKPANLFLARRADGSALVKVLDFGISKWAPSDDAAPALTATTAVMGSPLYMSPEQIRSSKRVDARSDVWSLGIILHELLTGRHAFEADTMPALCVQIVNDPPPPLRSHRPDAPAELERVVLQCLEKDLVRRFQNVAELARALRPFAPQSHLSVERIERLIPGGAPASTAGVEASAPGRPAVSATSTAWGAGGASVATRGSSRAIPIIAVASSVVAAGALVALVVMRSPGSASSSASRAGSSSPIASSTPDSTSKQAPEIPSAAIAPSASASVPAVTASASAPTVTPSARPAGTRPPLHPTSGVPTTPPRPQSTGVDPLQDQR